MNFTRHILYAGLPVAAALVLGGCEAPTSEKSEASQASNKTALAASISINWSQKSGLATSIGVGAPGTVFITGTNILPNGSHTAYRWSGSGWLSTNGSGFEAEVGASGSLWIIGGDNRVWMSTNNGANWTSQNSPNVIDIGVSSNGYVWALGSNYIVGTSDHPIFRRVNGNWVQTGGGGVRIDVDQDGFPFVVNSNDDLYEGNLDGSFFGKSSSVKATDIGVGPYGVIWIIGNTTVNANGDKTVYKKVGSVWEDAGFSAKRISVGSDGKPWIVRADGTIYQGL